ncbi:MAG TPA: SRPBCC domain-containing protein [Phycisphaerales bacterium]|nr:SRPBCC domain-containing protein [Phycisphaerales bacterium]
MPTLAPAATDLAVHIHKEVSIAAPAKVVFESILAQLGPESVQPDGKPLNLKLEPWPGGRWFRDLGNNTGHFWGHVQVIKPPTLLELSGPLFMSYAAINHVQYRVTEQPGGKASTLTLVHRALGDISPDHREGMTKGWEKMVTMIKDRAQRP